MDTVEAWPGECKLVNGKARSPWVQECVEKGNHCVEMMIFFFFNCYLAVPRPTLGHSQGDSLTNLMLITAFVHIRPESQREPRNEVGSLSPAERLAGFEPRTF